MNYLGHAFLSFGDADVLCGNMIGDFVKGSLALDTYTESVRLGLMLHRNIDTYTDSHEAISSAKSIFRSHYGLYSGAIVDTLMDHFLANDPRFFSEEQDLWDFAATSYVLLASKRHFFPPAYEPYFESMQKHNWLYHYRSEEGIFRALNGLMKRAKHIDEVDTAFRLLIQNKSELTKLYLAFIDDIISFVKIKLERR